MEDDEGALGLFHAVYDHPRADVGTRADAIFAIGSVFDVPDVNRRSRAYLRARDSVLEALESPSPRIRRSAIDSVGMMKEKRALPRLEHIAAHDRSRLPILGSVAASARDTMRFLRTGSWVVDNSSTCQG